MTEPLPFNKFQLSVNFEPKTLLTRENVQSSIAKLIQWVESHNYEAYDPGDGNNSYLNSLTFNVLILERILQQVIYRAPCNLRPILGVRPHRSTKGMGYMAWGYTKMFKITGQLDYRSRADFCLRWLMENSAPKYPKYCWGNDFSFSTRGGKIPMGEPTIVWSGLIGQAFLEAYEAFNEPQYLQVAVAVCEWILTLPREKTDRGVCLSYVTFNQSSIHNSNLLGGALLAKVGSIIKNQQFLDLAQESVLYSCSRIRDDGSWYYGEHSKYHWIDNFHTGYNLDCIRRYIDSSGDHRFDNALRDGFRYFQNTFFESDGCPKYYHEKKYPTDIQCCAQAIDTLAFFSDRFPEALQLSKKVAQWTLAHMQDSDGHFYYRKLGWATVRTPMLHWGQGTMFKALGQLLGRLTS